MKKLFVIGLSIIFNNYSFADDYVNGYFKKDGTYVNGHYKTSPNATNVDNYTTRPNVNPYTSNDGTKARDYSPEAYNYGGGRAINEGPRGGQYYYSDTGRKIYVPKR
jgi:PBCV-specific basic adaptor domain